MQNLDNVLTAVRALAGEKLGEFGCGRSAFQPSAFVRASSAWAAEDLNIVLALSLHAPDDETRSRIVPMNSAITSLKSWRDEALCSSIRADSEYRILHARRSQRL